MNRGVVAVILIIAAVALFVVYGWPKMKPYVTTPEPLPGGEMTTETGVI